MANKALATRQKMRLTVAPTYQSKPRNPVAVAAKLRAAGPHAKGPGQERQAAKRALRKASLKSEDESS
jgi:hypothetical protein